ncbi:PQQ-binding-like beta-propeller repeat protein [Klenkia sp. LSe6-5]|uniref:PQQ-binding-like beta-propeller repeat protein n=1 Tax=Klenkia sesuvii TaxID=3103137 RepID=A0ABU8DVH8_9ACTN
MTSVPRPPWRVLVWTAAALAVVLLAVVTWRTSDAAATTSTTSAPAAPVTGSPAAQLTEAWSATPGVPAGGDVVESDRVLVTAADGVAMADPATGEPAWSYTRSGARLCGATAVDQVVVVLFSTGGRCNELTALRADTGVRLWYRSVGFRADATLSSTDRIVLATSPTGLATVDPTGNGIRWHHAVPEGCRVVDATAGSLGVAALQDCGDQQQVVLLDGFDGSQRWMRELGSSPARLAGADDLVGVVSGDDLLALAPADGSTLTSTPLASTAGSADEAPLQTGAGAGVCVWARGTLYTLDATTGGLRWSVPAVGLPATGDRLATPGTVVVPEQGAMVTRDLATGGEAARSTTPSSTAELRGGARTAVVGDVVVLAHPDRVTAYR